MLGQRSSGICAAAPCALPRHWKMKGTLLLVAPILPTSAASSGYCTKMLTMLCSGECGTRTGRLSAIV